MFWKAVILLFLSLSVTRLEEEHAFYVSVFDYDLDHGSLEVKVFSDDLLNALHSVDSTITFNANPCSYSELLDDYMDDHLSTQIDREFIPFQIDHCDLVGDTHIFSSKIPTSDSITEIIIVTDFLIELFPDQKNVVKVNYRGERKMARMDEGNQEMSFSTKMN